MVAEGDFVAVFQSIHRVMKAEKLLKAQGLSILLIPAPRSISSDCGLALRYGPDISTQVEQVLAEASLLPEDRYVMEGDFRKL